MDVRSVFVGDIYLNIPLYVNYAPLLPIVVQKMNILKTKELFCYGYSCLNLQVTHKWLKTQNK